MIARRGPDWWHSAIVRGTGLLVLDFDDDIVGYFDLWANTAFHRCPIPARSSRSIWREQQGLGLGRGCSTHPRRELAEHGYLSTIVWALARQ